MCAHGKGLQRCPGIRKGYLGAVMAYRKNTRKSEEKMGGEEEKKIKAQQKPP